MKLPSAQRGRLACLAAALCLNAAFATAQENYPQQPVRIIVPFSPSGGTDIQARAYAQVFGESTGQQFIVDNRPGASGLIGAQIVVDSPPDGYNILFTTATLAVNKTLYSSRMKFNPERDLAPVSWLTSTPLVLVVHPSVPVSSVKELIELEKKQAGQLTIVPYKGGGPALIGLMSGETDFLFATAPSAMPHIRSGRVKPLAVTTEKRSSAFPKLPTVGEFVPGFASDNWYAMFVPKETPQPVIQKINAEIVKALKAPVVVKFMRSEGLDPVGSSPQELASLLRTEIAKYSKIIHYAGIKL
jgi:tripartite-type tricarboxylate transporter receptor subunit TctC